MEAPAKILIISSEGTDGFAVSALERQGWGIRSVCDSMQAVDVFEHLDPDLLLLELNIFSLNRVCFWDEIRSALCNGSRRKPIVVLFPSQSYSDEVAALDDGADDFLARPVSERVLVARVKRLLRSSNLSVT